MVLRAFLAITQEIEGEVVERQQYSHTSSSIKNNENFLQPQHSSCHKSIKSYTNGLSTRHCKELQSIGQQQFVMYVDQPCGPCSCHHCYQQIKGISPTIVGASVTSDISPFWIDLCQRSIEDKNDNLSNLTILYVSITGFFTHIYFYVLTYLVT